MGIRQAQIALSLASMARETLTLDVSSQILEAAGVFELEPVAQPNFTYVELGLMSGGTEQSNRAIQLAQGYVGPHQALSWTGRIETGADAYLFANFYSLTTSNYRLSASLAADKPNGGANAVTT
jgi:hypothetical protein